MPGIVIVGTGFGGIGMGIALKQAGDDDFIILVKEEDLRGTLVEQMQWDEDERRWDVQTVEHGELGSWRPRAVVSAAGALHLPAYPDIPGAERFAGTSFHSARWDHSVDLAGKRG